MIESVGICPDHGTVFQLSDEAVMKVRCAACGCMVKATTWYGISAGRAFEIEPPRKAA